eukprot:m.196991 g.196991  ORF g.196991 m.196991 type:complete len:491 (-) comp15705_c1_seq9:254-1726(-)
MKLTTRIGRPDLVDLVLLCSLTTVAIALLISWRDNVVLHEEVANLKEINSALRGDSNPCQVANPQPQPCKCPTCPTPKPTTEAVATTPANNMMPEFRPANRFGVLDYEYFTEKHIFSRSRVTDKGRVNRDTVGATLIETNMAVKFGLKKLREKGIDSLSFVSGQMRANPTLGTEFLLDYGKKLNRNNFDIPLVRVEMLRRASPEFEMISNTILQTQTVYMIMPLAGRLPQFQAFLERVEKHCLKSLPEIFNLHLSVIYFMDSTSEAGNVQDADTKINQMLAKFKEKYSGKFDFTTKVITDTKFSRGLGLETGVLEIEKNLDANDDKNPLFFFVDVDMMFTAHFIRTCVQNAKEHNQVYFPIVWSFYKGNDMPLQTSRYANTGIWRESGFGMACMHLTEFKSVGGFDKDVEGWGMEDVLIFEKFVQHESIVAMRAVDPNIYHLWHSKPCSLDQLQGDKNKVYMCQGALAMMEGDKRTIAMRLAKLEQETNS